MSDRRSDLGIDKIPDFSRNYSIIVQDVEEVGDLWCDTDKIPDFSRSYSIIVQDVEEVGDLRVGFSINSKYF